MCKFHIVSADGTPYDVTNVNRAVYESFVSTVTVEENDLLSHRYHVKRALWLFSSEGVYYINCENARCLMAIATQQ